MEALKIELRALRNVYLLEGHEQSGEVIYGGFCLVQ